MPGRSRVRAQRQFRLTAYVCWALAVGACDEPVAASAYDFEHVLYGADEHEECVFLWDAETVRYAFVSDALVRFDVHYHPQVEPTYLFGPEDLTSLGEQSVTAPEVGEFCLNWVNPGQTRVRLQYSFVTERE